jgi:phospholipid/cholesterol/gamma-HCH transport system substrate-binding protein
VRRRLLSLRRRCAQATLLVSVLALTACNGISDISLPGGSATSGKVYHIKVVFNDVLDLVPQSSVRVDDVPVGDVTHIALQGFNAIVTMRIKDSVKLPKNAHAELRSTSLLGEKFVALSPPAAPVKSTGRLADGDTVPLSATGRNPEFEEVFTALSALLNGGGVAQIQTISVELTNAFSGREAQVKDVLSQLTTLVSSLDKSKQQIVNALESIDRLAKRLAAQKGTIATALNDVPPALKVLADQEKDLARVLTSLSKLGGVGSRVIRETRDNTVASLRSLQPVLDSLIASKTNIVKSLELLLNFPFPSTAPNAVHGDYAGLYASVDLNITDLVAGLTGPASPTTQCPSGTLSVPLAGCVPLGGGTPTLPKLPSLPLSGGTGGTSGGTGGTGGLLGGILGTSYHGNPDYTEMMLAGAAT